jgi:hypothetical protein
MTTENCDTVKKEIKVFCRQCGGNRYHSTVAEKVDKWSEDDVPISGAETWAVVECCGCRTLTFLHERWFSEDTVETDHGSEAIVHRNIYPPAPARKLPEWSNESFILLDIPANDAWVFKLHQDVYAAIGLDSLRLSAIGIRVIVDHIVTWKAGDVGQFLDKLKRMCDDMGLISPSDVKVIYSAFDAGSAAVHRGYGPKLQHVYTMLDIAEALIMQFYVDPAMEKRREVAAAELKKNTPQRRKP